MKIRYVRDENAESPREWDCLGKMICFHKRHSLGDNHELRYGSFDGWDKLRQHVVEKLNGAVILPLYLLDHSGLTISTSPFNDPWDSGQVGFIYTTDEDILKNWMTEQLTGELLDKAKELLEAEVREYNMYLQGDCWGYIIEDDEGNQLDSCWGYLGRADVEQAGKEALAELEKAEAAKSEAKSEAAGNYRLVVCIDVDAQSLEEAYGKVYEAMTESGLEWESSDEAYDPDGKPISEDALSAVRMSYLTKREEG